MADFNLRSDSVNVEQIMDQIRTRIREKRGVDYTEQQIHELAKAKLDTFLDPRRVAADSVDRFRGLLPAYEPPELPGYEFGEDTLFESSRGPLRFIRRLLLPILKLFFNPNPLIQALHIQARLNTMNAEREAKREAMRLAAEQLYYELMHNLVVEMTRTGIEVKNLKMRIESLSGRVEFNERRARALESAVAQKQTQEEGGDRSPARRPPPAFPTPAFVPPPPPPQMAIAAPASAPTVSPTPGGAPPPEGAAQRSRRRRRRRGRRSGGPAAPAIGGMESGVAPQVASGESPEVIARDDLETITGAESHPSESAHAFDAPEPAAPVHAAREAESAPSPAAHQAESAPSPIPHHVDSAPDPDAQ